MLTVTRTNARGLMSGILQQGYSMGYVFAACANLGVGGGTDSWKTVFWIAAGISIGVGLIRIAFPESKQFVEAKKAGKNKAGAGAFWREFKVMLKYEWKMCIYTIILMTWFNYYSHTSQDSYTTFMLVQKELDNSGASRASIIMKVGACVGGTIIGYMSQFCGRRRSIIFASIMSGFLIPAWILPKKGVRPQCYGILDAVLRAGRLGRHPHSPERAVSCRLPLLVPRHHVPA